MFGSYLAAFEFLRHIITFCDNAPCSGSDIVDLGKPYLPVGCYKLIYQFHQLVFFYTVLLKYPGCHTLGL